MNKESIKEVLVSQKKLFLEKSELFGRDIVEGFHERFSKIREAIIITGIRRCGKSSLMRLLWDEFKEKENLTADQFLYVNFEDERLAGFGHEDFSKLLEAHGELWSPDKTKRIFLLLDEIQNVALWEKWINRIYEEDKYRIFITGSNATLLSSELSTALTGRNIPITLFPLSFHEYLVHFKNKKISSSSFYDQTEKTEIKKIFEEYLVRGGMPEYVKTGSVELVQEYFKDIISRDIVNRYRVKYKQELKELARLLLATPGQIQSLNAISRSVGMKNISTVKNYLQYLEDSFLFFRLSLFSFSLKKQIYNPGKYFVADAAFFQNIAFKFSDNLGSVYENIVFSELKWDSRNELFYVKTEKNFEVDFAVKKKNKLEKLIQVSVELEDKKTAEREERALLAAMQEFNLSEGLILNRDLEKTGEREGKNIFYIPLWKWLLRRYWIPEKI